MATNNTLLDDPEVRLLIQIKARQMARSKHLRDRSVEDLEHDLILALLQAPAYAPERGSQAAFATIVLRTKGANLVRAQRTKRRSGRPVSLGRPDSECDGDDDGENFEPVAQEEDPALQDLYLEVKAVLEGLPPELRSQAEQLLWPDAHKEAGNSAVAPPVLQELILRLAPYFQHLNRPHYEK